MAVFVIKVEKFLSDQLKFRSQRFIFEKRTENPQEGFKVSRECNRHKITSPPTTFKDENF